MLCGCCCRRAACPFFRPSTSHTMGRPGRRPPPLRTPLLLRPLALPAATALHRVPRRARRLALILLRPRGLLCGYSYGYSSEPSACPPCVSSIAINTTPLQPLLSHKTHTCPLSTNCAHKPVFTPPLPVFSLRFAWVYTHNDAARHTCWPVGRRDNYRPRRWRSWCSDVSGWVGRVCVFQL